MRNRFIYIFVILALFSSEKLYAFDYNYTVTATASAPTGKGKVYASQSDADSPDWNNCGTSASVSKNGTGNYISGPTSNTLYLYAKPETAYQFSGWGTSATQTTGLSADNPIGVSFVSNEDGASTNWTKNRYAIFSPITYTITYNPDGGTVSGANTQSYTIESTDALNTATKTGATFGGWKVTAVNGDGNWVLGETAVSPLNRKYGNVTLTAQWASADITITVSGLGSNDNAFFTVSNGDGVLYTVTLSGSNPSVTIKDLPTEVQYTVRATNTWSWAYGNPSPATAVFSLGSSGYTANFTYSKNTSAKKHDEQINVNWHTPSL